MVIWNQCNQISLCYEITCKTKWKVFYHHWKLFEQPQGRILNILYNFSRQNDLKFGSKLARKVSCLLQSRKHPLTYLARAISALFLPSPLYHHQKSGHTEILRTPDRTPIKEFQEVVTRWTLPSNHLLSLLSSYHGQELDGKETVEQIGPCIPEMLSVTVLWKSNVQTLSGNP